MATEIEVRDRAAVDVALLIARLIVGVVFKAYGAPRSFLGFAGPGHSAVVQMMGPLGYLASSESSLAVWGSSLVS
jgi:uncharacterized membrane protein YphA (DoxX/SURF4 family)